MHIGHELSFAYDIADLYKAEITIPIAFRIAAENPENLPSETRRRVRDAISEAHLLERMVKDIKYLLSDEDNNTVNDQEPLYLWDNKKEKVDYGKSYTEEDLW